MANSLLDFVISLVRDPEAAARYAADPAKSIADAHLVDVTSVDVNNLIPMVSDSLSMGNPAGAAGGSQIAEHSNVWASGAATAAFDAFAPHTPATVVSYHQPANGVIQQPIVHQPVELPAEPQPVSVAPHDPSFLVTDGEVHEWGAPHGGFPPDDPGLWHHPVVHPDAPQPDHPDFGIHG
ncbi:IniB N-terminal domain-containing protein [Mycobacterium sp. 1423905.2]|uniref:Rv0340 family IniB-related protein n=1 Tax=Mycobacterium sp. 1423905.2 TaxID=1856859 RepID=UPI0007FFC5DA|nr:IniB N-terminal domain-containing protein [Mycobacterium sp. 1423905.2]OBJ47555.1 hypothetical protein A9W95_06655 [Mycobacterium sp. 1423905.2]